MQIEEFMHSLSGQTRSAETLRAYRQDLQRFKAYLEAVSIAAGDVRSVIISSYVAHLNAGRVQATGSGLAPATVCRRLAVVSEYYEWLQRDSDDPLRNPVKLVRRPKVQNIEIRSVEDGHLECLVNGITNPRDKAIVLLFIYSGFRLSELRSLDKTSIIARLVQGENGTSAYFGEGFVIGKGGKQRSFRVGPKALQAVAAYISADRGADVNSALFLSSRKERLSCRAIQHVVSTWCSKLGVPRIHPHQLRHSFATRSITGGCHPMFSRSSWVTRVSVQPSVISTSSASASLANTTRLWST